MLSKSLPAVPSSRPAPPPKDAPFDAEYLVRPNIRALVPYRCARDDYSEGVLLDANENAHGACVVDPAIVPAGVALERYPCPRLPGVKTALAALRGTSPERVFLGVGSDECIDLLLRVVCVPGRDRILVTPPTYGMYSVCAAVNDVGVTEVPLKHNFQLDVGAVTAALDNDTSIKAVFLCSPGNPTGTLLHRSDVLALLEHRAYRGLVVVDEAYIDYAPDDASFAGDLARFPNLVVLQTLSKSFGLAGIRLGAALAHPTLIQYMSAAKAPYSISTPTALIAAAALSPAGVAAMRASVAKANAEKAHMIHILNSERFAERVRLDGCCHANFVLALVLENGVPSSETARRVYTRLAESDGVVVRYRGGEIPGCLRITVGTREENDHVLASLQKALCEKE